MSLLRLGHRTCSITNALPRFRPPRRVTNPAFSTCSCLLNSINRSSTTSTGSTNNHGVSKTSKGSLNTITDSAVSPSSRTRRLPRSSTSWRRGRHAAAAAAPPGQDDTVYTSDQMSMPMDHESSRKMDDETLRAMFDNPAASLARSQDLAPTGLFLHPRLQSPEYMQTLTSQTLQHGIHLVDRICSVLPPSQFQPIHPESPFASYLDHPRSAYEHANALRMVPKLLDRLSDVLCLVIDMAELVRNVHPDERWIAESDRAYERLGSFMNGLNTHQGLYQVSLHELSACHHSGLD